MSPISKNQKSKVKTHHLFRDSIKKQQIKSRIIWFPENQERRCPICLELLEIYLSEAQGEWMVELQNKEVQAEGLVVSEMFPYQLE